jgi:hypothetical protein
MTRTKTATKPIQQVLDFLHGYEQQTTNRQKGSAE